MAFITSIGISFGLVMDAFAVSLGVGTSRSACDKRSIFRLSFHFGLVQGLMTFLGWLAGSTISLWIENFDHWIPHPAFGSNQDRRSVRWLKPGVHPLPDPGSCPDHGLIPAGLSLFGLCAGNMLGKWFGKKMEILGGLILIGIGIRILVSHLWLS